jgi:hypothetical protein
LNRNKNLIIDESRTSLLFESLKLIKSTEELSHVFASFGYRNEDTAQSDVMNMMADLILVILPTMKY